MRSQDQLLHSRTRVKPRYALLPLEGVPLSRLPDWSGVEVRVLAAPVLGANFVEYLLDFKSGSSATVKADGRIETFFYVLRGSAKLTIDKSQSHTLTAGGFALLPPNASYELKAAAATKLLMLKKVYEPATGIATFAPLIGNQSKVKADIYCGDEGAKHPDRV